MSGSFTDYAAEMSAGFQEGVEDMTRAGYEDIGNAYQEFLMADSGIRPPDSLIGDMVTTGPEAEPAPQSYDAAMREHQAMLEAEQQARTAPEISAPDSSDPELDAA